MKIPNNKPVINEGIITNNDSWKLIKVVINIVEMIYINEYLMSVLSSIKHAAKGIPRIVIIVKNGINNPSANKIIVIDVNIPDSAKNLILILFIN